MAIYADKKDGKLTGRWRVEVQQGGKRARGRFDTLEAAQRAELMWKQRFPQDDAVEREDTRGVPHRLVDLIAKSHGVVWRSKASRDICEIRLHILLNLFGRQTLVKDITTEALDRVVAKLLDDDRKPATVNRYLSHLHKLMVWAQERKWLSEIPVFPWQDEEGGRIRWVTDEEEEKLYEHLPTDVAALVRVAIMTGCRRGELLSLTREQIEPRQIHLWKTKTKTPRTVPISDDTYQLLMWLMEHGMPSKNALRYAWDKARAAMGLANDPWFVFHVCRHTCATRLVRANVNLRVIQTWMGHRRIETTIRYAQVGDTMLHDALGRLDSHLDIIHVRIVDPSPTVGYSVPHHTLAAKKSLMNQSGRGGTGRRAGFRFQKKNPKLE